ncbi:MAG TPA: retroviral-like aspartic protease family protein [Polyangia bacterium]|nr:retroviral-like aspartic protease family protein [Polyangia bacterium]
MFIGAGRIGLIAGLVVSGCALPPWIGHHPVFPSGGASSWEIPLYEPLTGLGPKVRATVCGPSPPAGPRACEEALLYVDTGSSHSALPEATLARLGVEVSASRFATIEDAAGDKRAWAGGLVSEMRLGDGLSLADVVTVVHEQTAILGADVLMTRGWRIDLDRGMLLLGAQRASPAPPAARLPIRGFPARTIVDLSVQGRGVPVLLDTGAPITVIDAGWLRELGLPLRTLQHGWPLSARDPSTRLTEATEAALRLGEADLGRRQVVAHPREADESMRGMLGLDVLSDFAFGVSQEALELARRAPSPFAAVPVRVARWHDAPNCPDVPGCVHVQLDQADQVLVRMRSAASSSRPWRYLFGCVDREGRPRDFTIWIEVALRTQTAGQERVLEVPMPEQLRQIWAVECPALALLDVNPVLPAVRPMTGDAEARIALSNRRLRLE